MAVHKFNKLVRDRIPLIIERHGEHAKYRRLGQAEFRRQLKRKLAEEARELAVAKGGQLVGEIADAVEVLRALAQAYGIRWAAVEKYRQAKRRQRGGFARKVFLISSQR